MKLDFDAIIVGGGPAGLSVGSELAKSHNILLIESGQIGHTDKSWFVPKETLVKNEELRLFANGSVKRFLANTFTGGKLHWETHQNDLFPFIESESILNFWATTIKSNDSTILEKCSYLSHSSEKCHVVVHTSLGTFSSKLLIDASGDNSPIRATYDEAEPEKDYWWSVCGCIAKHTNGLSGDLKVGDYEMWKTFHDDELSDSASLSSGRPVFEYEILNENTSFPLILYLTREKQPLKEMKETFFRILREEAGARDFHDVEVDSLKFGWYPSGGKPSKAKDRVIFVGSSGSWATPCGWGMGYILNNYKAYSLALSTQLTTGRLSAEDLTRIGESRGENEFQRLFNKMIMRFLAESSTAQVDKFISVFNQIDPHVCEKMFTLKITRSEIWTFTKVALKNFNLLELISIFRFTDFIIISKIIYHCLYHKVVCNNPYPKGRATYIDKDGYAIESAK